MRHITIIAMLAFAPAVIAQDFRYSPLTDPEERMLTRLILEGLARLQTEEGRVAWRSNGVSEKGVRELVEYAKQAERDLERRAKQIQGRICVKKGEYLRDPIRLAATLDAEGEAFEHVRYMTARGAPQMLDRMDATMFYRLINRRMNVPPHPGSYGHLIRIGDLSAERFLTVYCSE